MGDALCTAINKINAHMQDLNEFFEEFDVYEGRLFHSWELDEIFGGHITLNQKTSLLNTYREHATSSVKDTVSYKFVYDTVQTAPNCPARFKDDILRQGNQSIYSTIDHKLTQNPQVLELVQEILGL